MNTYDICIIGGGASGMAAAIAASMANPDVYTRQSGTCIFRYVDTLFGGDARGNCRQQQKPRRQDLELYNRSRSGEHYYRHILFFEFVNSRSFECDAPFDMLYNKRYGYHCDGNRNAETAQGKK